MTSIRSVKKSNKKIINDLLYHINFPLSHKRFASSYFVFDLAPASICYFKLKDLPHWLFAIWLDPDRFYFLGEVELLIDKFKPNRTSICHINDIISPIEDIYKLIESDGFLDSEQKEWYFKVKALKSKSSKFNLETYQLVKFVIEKYRDDGLNINLTDWGSNTYPRYIITLQECENQKIIDNIENELKLIDERTPEWTFDRDQIQSKLIKGD